MIDSGHLVRSRTWSHANLSSLSSLDRKLEMWKNEIVIRNSISVYPSYMRAPYGDCNAACISDMHELGYHVVGTGYDTGDWRTDFNLTMAKLDFDEMLAKVPKNGRLMISQHDLVKISALELTEHMVNKLRERDFWFGSVGDCVGEDLPHWHRKSNESDTMGVVSSDAPEEVRNGDSAVTPTDAFV